MTCRPTLAAAAQGRSSTRDLGFWPFNLWVNACRETTIEYMCTKYGVDSSSRFPFRAQTDATERPTHAGSHTAGVGERNNSLTYVNFNGLLPGEPPCVSQSPIFFLQLFQKRMFGDKWNELFLHAMCPSCQPQPTFTQHLKTRRALTGTFIISLSTTEVLTEVHCSFYAGCPTPVAVTTTVLVNIIA